ncbi:MAG: class I SAM-dependent methyltransferase [Dysgonomonas sp.]|nr:class I SAM-dependent methyltransferase [Dysgonomonas sp.]
MELNKKDRDNLVKIYTEKYNEHGYSPKALGWDKGKQNVRFEILTSQINLENKSILDIGCGFGDLNKYLSTKLTNYTYYGVDMVETSINEATSRHPHNAKFKCGDFLQEDLGEFDYAVASGIFNLKLENEDSYSFIENTMKKAMSICRVGIAFDFLSDKVDYPLEHTFHASPEKLLSMAYKYTRNIVLRNDYMPFEFTLFMFKDDSFEKADTIFNSYKKNKLI